jgi:cytochrome c5
LAASVFLFNDMEKSMKTALVLTLSTVIMFICPMGIATEPEPSAATIDTPKAQKTVDAQAMADLAAGNRSNMPGAAHYDKACATCHEGAVQKAPHRGC